MATGALDANGIWQYGEDDSNTTFSALINRLGTSIGSTMKGRIAQVVVGTTNTPVVSTSASYIDTGLSATITPKSSASKILIFLSQHYSIGSSAESWVSFRLLRGTTSILEPNTTYEAGAQVSNRGRFNTSTVDSPATTSAVTYKTQFLRYQAAATVQELTNYSKIILVEVTA